MFDRYYLPSPFPYIYIPLPYRSLLCYFPCCDLTPEIHLDSMGCYNLSSGSGKAWPPNGFDTAKKFDFTKSLTDIGRVSCIYLYSVFGKVTHLVLNVVQHSFKNTGMIFTCFQRNVTE